MPALPDNIARSPITSLTPTIPVILGPTASGKTAAAVALATRLMAADSRQVAILSADSRQVYVRGDIGTAKPEAKLRLG